MKIFRILILIFLLSSCSTPVIDPTHAPSLIKTLVQTGSSTNIPSSSPQQSATITRTPVISPPPFPLPPIAPTGPYLISLAEDAIIVLNQDGSGKQILPIPEGMVLENISPNGKRGVLLACDNPDCSQAISLKLIHIPGGDVESLAVVIPKGNTDLHSGDIQKNIQWSPDGRYLAFVAIPSGSSADLFVYDTRNEKLKRLTNDSLPTGGVEWSPDGKWIVFENLVNSNSKCIEPGVCSENTEDTFTLNATSPENGMNIGIRELSAYVSRFFSGTFLRVGWISDTELLFIEGCGDGGYCGGLSFLDVQNGKKRSIWDGDFSFWIEPGKGDVWPVDPVNREAVLCGYRPLDQPAESGCYLVSSDGRTVNKLPTDNYFNGMNLPIYRGGPKYRFVTSNESGMFGITTDGVIDKISDRDNAYFSVSPMHEWCVSYNGSGMDVYSGEDILIRSVEGIAVWKVIWPAEQNGFYFMAETREKVWGIYYWSFSDPAPQLIYLSTEQEECNMQGTQYSPNCVLFWSP